jgi:Tfp pilus assembly protein PilF
LLAITASLLKSSGDQNETRRRIRLIGCLLLIAGLMPLAIAVLTQFYGDFPATNYFSAGSDARPATIASASAQAGSSNTMAISSPPANNRADQPTVAQVPDLLREAFQFVGQERFDDALAKVNAILQVEPKNPGAYALRGNIYAAKKLWSLAEQDYQTALQLDDKKAAIKFNLAELEFMQKKYDAARPGFVDLEQDPDYGDLSSYKTFVCDLFGGHEDVAARELDAFNAVGSNASYYFANATWSLYHQKTDDARSWLTSAAHIYPPAKFRVYSASLIELGYPEKLSGHSSP